jgi:hypothetical protein
MASNAGLQGQNQNILIFFAKINIGDTYEL